ncbi:MAG: 4Fe-4S binding protein [Deltaproteobacteria bacterium]|nr:4Fe-4S binding protein [Deltaproteobacteria bacterium]MBI3293762.1 4Fe-4S binding protein [Deltaproteobacteria bacterium]
MDRRLDNPALEKAPRKTKTPTILAIIDQKGCTGCHACIPFCPVDCIEQVPGVEHPDFMRVVEVDLERCIGCKACAKVCPWETIFMVQTPEADDKAKEWTLRSVMYQGVGTEEKKAAGE